MTNTNKADIHDENRSRKKIRKVVLFSSSETFVLLFVFHMTKY